MSSFYDLSRLGVTFRPIDTWPGHPNHDRRHSPFTASLRETLGVLERELRMLDAERIVLQIAVRERDIRQDGYPRADARPSHPGVILAFESRWGPLKYATDEFHTWQDNLRAVALAMEALRKVDRYGVSKRGEQYRGWQQIAAKSSEPADAIVDREGARRFLDEHGGSFADAAKKLHPDRGGDPALFRAAVKARELIGAGA